MIVDDPNAPLILADGTKIDPVTGAQIKERKYSTLVEIPAAKDAIAAVARSRRSVAELPIPGPQMNALSLVLFYTMFGLSDQDISLQVGSLSLQQVKRIKTLPEYLALQEDMLKAKLENEATDVRAHIARHAMNAAQKVIDTMEEDGALGFAAAKDILDRSGNRPVDVIEHKHKMDGGLRIEIVNKTASEDIPILEGDLLDVTPRT